MKRKMFISLLLVLLISIFIFPDARAADTYSITPEDFAVQIEDIYNIQITGNDFVPISFNGIPEDFNDYILSGSINLKHPIRDEIGGNISVDQALVRNGYNNYIFFYRIVSTPKLEYFNEKVTVEIDIIDDDYKILDYEPKNLPGTGTETKSFGLKAGFSDNNPVLGVSVGASIESANWSELNINNESKITGFGEKGTFLTSFIMDPAGTPSKYSDLSPFIKNQVVFYGMLKLSSPSVPLFNVNFGGSFSSMERNTMGYRISTNFETATITNGGYYGSSPVEQMPEVSADTFKDYVKEFYQIEINEENFTPISLTGRIESLEDYVLTDTVIISEESGALRGRFTINQILIRNSLGNYIYAYRMASTPYTIFSSSGAPQSEVARGYNSKASVKVNILTDNYAVLKTQPSNIPVSGASTASFDIEAGLTGADLTFGYSMSSNWSEISVNNQSEIAHDNGSIPGYMHIDYDFAEAGFPGFKGLYPYLENEAFVYGMFKFSSPSLPRLEIIYGGEIARDNNFFGWKKLSDYDTNYYNGCEQHIYEGSRNCIICGHLLEVNEEIDLHCRSNEIKRSPNLDVLGESLFKVNIECAGHYQLKTLSSYGSDIIVYDHNMIPFNINQTSTNNGLDVSCSDVFEKGTYYIKVNNKSDLRNNEVNITFNSRINNIKELPKGSNYDVLEHLHDGNNKMFFSTSTPGFYNIILMANNDMLSSFPAGAITIKDESGNLVQKYSFTDYDNSSSSLDNSNNMIIYAESYKRYYVDVNYFGPELTSLTLKADNLGYLNLDARDSLTESLSLYSGDKIGLLNVERAGEYTIKATYHGSQAESSMFVIYKKNSDTTFTIIRNYLMNANNDFCSNNVLISSSDEIYVGFFNARGIGSLTLEINRNISNTFSLITDPTANDTVGSEVTLNNGAYGGTTLTQGYTRICYLGINAPYLESRTLYNWYSTNSSVAVVSPFGTVTATGTWTDGSLSKTVIIRAVYKTDPTVVGEIELTVYKETNHTPVQLQYGMDVREGGVPYGTEVSSGLGQAIQVGYNPEVTIHRGKTRLICVGLDSPTASIQDFDWSAYRQGGESGHVYISQFGTITGVYDGTITIKGVYKYNPKYTVDIRVTVLL